MRRASKKSLKKIDLKKLNPMNLKGNQSNLERKN
jgi:hypothetical protein